jgi:hypothetical protein
MAKPIILSHNGNESSFGLRKLSRSKLYGRKQRIPIGPDGAKCSRAALTHDGSLMIVSGMTAQGYFTADGDWIPNKELIGLDDEGNDVALVPSTLGIPQELRGPLKPQEVLDLHAEAFHSLTPEEVDPALQKALDAGDIFGFDFNYRGDYQMKQACLVSNKEGIFILVGQPAQPEWCELESVATTDQTGMEEENGEDLDFEMF